MTKANNTEKIEKFLQLKIEKLQQISDELYFEIYGVTTESTLINDNLKDIDYNQIKTHNNSALTLINEVEKYLNSELGELHEQSIKFIKVLFVNKDCLKNKISINIRDNDKNRIYKYGEILDQIILFNQILFFFKNLLFYDFIIKIDERELIKSLKKLFDYIRYVAPRTILKNDTRSQKEKANITLKEKAKLEKVLNDFNKISVQISKLSKFDSTEINSIIIEVNNIEGYSTKIMIPNEYVDNLINISAIKNTFTFDNFSFIHKQDIQDVQENENATILTKAVPVVIKFLEKYTVSILKLKRKEQLAFVYDLFVFIGLIKKDIKIINGRLLIDDKNNCLKKFLKYPVPSNYRL